MLSTYSYQYLPGCIFYQVARSIMSTLLAAGWFSVLGVTPAWSACLPDEGAQSVTQPYEGYRATGYKGSPERDEIWHREVRVISTAGRSLQYELIDQPGNYFDSIEPIHLGSGSEGFVASRNGCQQLLNRRGEALAIPLFEKIVYEDTASYVEDQVMFRLSTGSNYTLVLFRKGRVFSVSSREYLNKHIEPMPFWPGYLRLVSAEQPGGYGVVDLRDLHEVLVPEWNRITPIGVKGDDRASRYLLAYGRQGGTLFSIKGGTALIRNVASLETVENFFPFWPGSRSIERAAIALRINGEQGCRLLDMRLRSLMSHLLPIRNGRCDTGNPLSERRYIFTDADKHHVHAYAIEPHSQLRQMSTTPGQIAAAREETGLMVIKIQTKQGAKYRIYFADGRLASQEIYNDFQVLGCGLMEVKSQQKWLSLFDDGSVVPERYYPLSC